MLRAKEGHRKRVREREGKRGREGKREREGKRDREEKRGRGTIGEERMRWRVRERIPHKLEGEASTDHPIGEGLG